MPDRGVAKLDELARWVGEAPRKRDRDRRQVKAKRLAGELARGGDIIALDLWEIAEELAMDPAACEIGRCRGFTKEPASSGGEAVAGLCSGV